MNPVMPLLSFRAWYVPFRQNLLSLTKVVSPSVKVLSKRPPESRAVSSAAGSPPHLCISRRFFVHFLPFFFATLANGPSEAGAISTAAVARRAMDRPAMDRILSGFIGQASSARSCLRRRDRLLTLAAGSRLRRGPADDSGVAGVGRVARARRPGGNDANGPGDPLPGNPAGDGEGGAGVVHHVLAGDGEPSLPDPELVQVGAGPAQRRLANPIVDADGLAAIGGAARAGDTPHLQGVDRRRL